MTRWATARAELRRQSLDQPVFALDWSDRLDNDGGSQHAEHLFDANGKHDQLRGRFRYDWADRLTNSPTVTNIVYDAAGNR